MTLRSQFDQCLENFKLTEAPPEMKLVMRAFYFSGVTDGVVAFTGVAKTKDTPGSHALREEVHGELQALVEDQQKMNNPNN